MQRTVQNGRKFGVFGTWTIHVIAPPMKAAEYISELNTQLAYLFGFTRAINELDFAGAHFNEFRGMQDGGWTTTITAHEVFSELHALGTRESPLSQPEYRQVLCLYAQLSEAGGIYEGLLNLFGVVQRKPWNSWPFQDMVRVHSQARRVIGPNANAMFRRLAQTAASIGMAKLAELLEITFNDDVRNGMFHADYIIGSDGLRLRRRNGGNAYVISHSEISELITIGLGFFDLFTQMQRKSMESFRPGKRIVGRFSTNPPMAWTVEYGADGSFGISGDSIGPETDSSYERQEKINAYLNGRVFAAYANDEAGLSRIQEVLSARGFDALTATLNNEELAKLEREIEAENLWLASVSDEGARTELLATPFGFVRWVGRAAWSACFRQSSPLSSPKLQQRGSAPKRIDRFGPSILAEVAAFAENVRLQVLLRRPATTRIGAKRPIN